MFQLGIIAAIGGTIHMVLEQNEDSKVIYIQNHIMIAMAILMFLFVFTMFGCSAVVCTVGKIPKFWRINKFFLKFSELKKFHFYNLKVMKIYFFNLQDVKLKFFRFSELENKYLCDF